MALGLHSDCKSKIRATLECALSSLKVERGALLTGRSGSKLWELDHILPTQGALRNQLSSYISESPAYDFFGSILGHEIGISQRYDPGKQEVPLNEVEGYEDLSATADRLVDLFDSLPWNYVATFRLPQGFSEVFRAIGTRRELGPRVSVAFPDDDSFRDYEPPAMEVSSSSLLNLNFEASQGWKEDHAYLQVGMIGFVDRFSPTTPMIEALALLRSLCGLGLALRLWKIRRSYRPAPPKASYYVHKREGDRWLYQYKDDLPTTVGSGVEDLVFDDLEGYVKAESMSNYLEICARKISVAFSAGERSQRILLAAQWHFDGYADSDELLSFVRAAVVAEILLGDKAASDSVGLTELLANRCAYLISRSHKEREQILTEFKTIYNIRSKIVHQGKARFNSEERRLLSRLRWMCMRMIQEECSLLERDQAA